MARRTITIVDDEYAQYSDTGTFIEKYGYVQYRNRLPYPRVGPCEVLGCGIHKTFAYTIARITDAEYVRWMERERFCDPAFNETLDCPRRYTDDQIRQMLENRLIAEKRSQARVGKTGFVFDHCHEHGWIRGVICASCNGKMRNVDLRMEYSEVQTIGFDDDYPIELELPTPAYNRHWEKCPDCRKTGPWTAMLGGISTRRSVTEAALG